MELYDIIELMLPGSKKIELFARNHNLRHGWFSLGNQLGGVHEKWINKVNCDVCNLLIICGQKRYKARHRIDFDVCHTCFLTKHFKLENFYQLNNNITEDVLHKYLKCNNCGIEPIWGIKFSCLQCPNYDLCESCIDQNLKLFEDQKFH